MPREEWRHEDDHSDEDALDKLDGAVVTPLRVKDRLERAAGLFSVVESGDDLTTVEDEDDLSVQRWRAERAVRADAARAFRESAALIPGFSEPGRARELLARMTAEVIATGLVPGHDAALAARTAMLIAVEFHGEMKQAATKGDGAGRVMRQASPLPDAYLTHGAFSANTRTAYGYAVAETDYVRLEEGLGAFMKALSESGMRVGGRLIRLAVSDQTLTVNGIEREFLRWARGREGVVCVLRNPQGKPYSACYANIAGQNRLFYPDFVVAMADGRMVAVETKYDRKDLREKMAGRGDGAGLPVVFVVRNPVTGGLDMVVGHDETGREIARPLDLNPTRVP